MRNRGAEDRAVCVRNVSAWCCRVLSIFHLVLPRALKGSCDCPAAEPGRGSRRSSSPEPPSLRVFIPPAGRSCYSGWITSLQMRGELLKVWTTHFWCRCWPRRYIPLVVPLGDGYEKTSTMAHPFGNYSPGIFPIKQHGPGPQEVMCDVWCGWSSKVLEIKRIGISQCLKLSLPFQEGLGSIPGQ